MTELEIANVVGMLTYQQEPDLAALAETFDGRDEITDVTYKPADNHWLQTRFAPTTRTSPSIGPGAVRLLVFVTVMSEQYGSQDAETLPV